MQKQINPNEETWTKDPLRNPKLLYHVRSTTAQKLKLLGKRLNEVELSQGIRSTNTRIIKADEEENNISSK